MMKRKLFDVLLAAFLATLVLLVILFLSSRISDFEFKNTEQIPLSFQSEGNTLSGTLLLPKGGQPEAVVILIHGDGPMDRFADQGYNPLFNMLLTENVAIFSWDKAGIGKSSGNWLLQSMSDRADEAIAAKEMITRHLKQPKYPIGFLGYSQAGWVIPIAASRVDADFSVIIGGAVNWRDQGQYYQKIRYQNQNKSASEIKALLHQERQDNDRIFGEHSPKNSGLVRHDMSADRFTFVGKNYLNDSMKDLTTMRGPVWVVLGSDDLNVDARTDVDRFRTGLAGNPQAKVSLIENATHTLMKAPTFNYQLEQDWPWWKKVYFLYLGRDAYLVDSYRQITQWIKEQ